mgnify:CR=1 FL=1
MSPEPEDWTEDYEIINAVTLVVRQADVEFEGGSSRHWVRDWFLPLLAKAGWRVVKEVTNEP